MDGKDALSQQIIENFPAPRMAPFLAATDNDTDLALELYSWNAQMAGAVLEQISHLEVLLRHAIDQQLSISTQEKARGIPWFLLPPYYGSQQEAIDSVRERLRPLGRETRDQIIAGLSFGYWSGWVGAKYEELWRQSLHKAFPNGSGKRKEIAGLVEQIRKFRNRVAHHDSLLGIDVGFEMNSIFRLAEIISPEAAQWMRKIDRTHEVGKQRPVTTIDTVVVPASDAWEFYLTASAYICQPGRHFQKVKYIAFYSDKEIKTTVAQVKNRFDNVVWNADEAEKLLDSEKRDDRRLGKVMHEGIKAGWLQGKYQVFLLSQEHDPQTIHLEEPLINTRRGKGSAFVRKQKYTSIHRLRHARDIWDI